MKKNRITSALLALALITAAAPLQAAQDSEHKDKFYTTLKAFKRCIKGKCTPEQTTGAARLHGVATFQLGAKISDEARAKIAREAKNNN